jgi:hypothetical protein
MGSAGGPQGISVPRFNQSVVHISPDVPPKVDAAAEIRIKSIPLGFMAPAMHIRIPPALKEVLQQSRLQMKLAPQTANEVCGKLTS